MNTQELTSYLDELLFSKTGEHLDSLQRSIIRGVLNGKKYADIAKEYNCSAGHAKDEAYKLWQLLVFHHINKETPFCFQKRIPSSALEHLADIFLHHCLKWL